jgi:hypothetical protein
MLFNFYLEGFVVVGGAEGQWGFYFILSQIPYRMPMRSDAKRTRNDEDRRWLGKTFSPREKCFSEGKTLSVHPSAGNTIKGNDLISV